MLGFLLLPPAKATDSPRCRSHITRDKPSVGILSSGSRPSRPRSHIHGNQSSDPAGVHDQADHYRSPRSYHSVSFDSLGPPPRRILHSLVVVPVLPGAILIRRLSCILAPLCSHLPSSGITIPQWNMIPTGVAAPEDIPCPRCRSNVRRAMFDSCPSPVLCRYAPLAAHLVSSICRAIPLLYTRRAATGEPLMDFNAPLRALYTWRSCCCLCFHPGCCINA